MPKEMGASSSRKERRWCGGTSTELLIVACGVAVNPLRLAAATRAVRATAVCRAGQRKRHTCLHKMIVWSAAETYQSGVAEVWSGPLFVMVSS